MVEVRSFRDDWGCRLGEEGPATVVAPRAGGKYESIGGEEVSELMLVNAWESSLSLLEFWR